MADDLVVSKSVVIPQAELRWKFSRSSGPGGQSVNTTDSKVQLVFDLRNSRALSEHLRTRALARLESKLVDGCVVISASEQRSQLQNRRAAEQRLVEVLKEATAPPPRARRPTRPTKASAERRIKEKKGRGRTKALRGSTNKDVE
ncbi:MAG: aminoacyl-tRNA hydrolase [Actinobacteria bacterium]|nr:aminoacyl-tRNA hydrolase [Actinomycetota bacterium]